ncbi:carboxypeptidase-like regulatory domain-containing protein [Croceitalea rosinachiae]|uniref:Carboxypeptidase-like regulatory domain-containing protein n=1 Tax=Croceitalea rosinachiae TaxID=3075596 RepID=A0ABU3AB15_9FLAO|nr:carboxypeptidase-like regulatory domain-containing protein [Croceitalea sp. F388]MDT0607374.1 carboxypeptidase-like regulatory domain-containing protein [Croceitalea sp. F388]
MIKKIILSFILGCTITTYSVAQRDYKGKIIDSKTGEAIPFVNIGIVEQGIGTVSDEEGLFHLYFEENQVKPTEILLFSALGYAPLNIPLSKMPLVYNEYPVFKMKPERIALNEVVVSNKGERFVTDFVGYKNRGEQTYGYWKDQIALGGELATRIVVKSGLRRLDQFQFEVFHNPSDSLLLRVNIYEDDGPIGSPKTNLNKSGKNVLVTLKKTDKIVWVDLKPYDIYVKDDFLVSLELLKVYGEKELGLVLAAAFDKYGSYRKYASQDKWERMADESMAYYLETQFMVSEKVAQRFEKKEARKKKKIRTISGFALRKGRMVPGVEVTNTRTKETVFTDEDGRYTIAADKRDEILFKKQGYKLMVLTVGDRPTANIIMKGE